jgi:hypothetical protein
MHLQLTAVVVAGDLREHAGAMLAGAVDQAPGSTLRPGDAGAAFGRFGLIAPRQPR